jgi:hypothetical protein
MDLTEPIAVELTADERRLLGAGLADRLRVLSAI